MAKPIRYSKRSGPTIIALDHGIPDYVRGSRWYTRTYLPQLRRGEREVKTLFERASGDGRKRTLFIEAHQQSVEKHLQSKQIEGKLEDTFCYEGVIKTAARLGWSVVPIDLDISRVLASGAWKNLGVRRLAVFNARESKWAEQLGEARPQPQDFIVMHPLHVKGFLAESGMRGKRVRWVHKPDRDVILNLMEAYSELLPQSLRLNSGERRKLWRKYLQGRLAGYRAPQLLFEKVLNWPREPKAYKKK